MSIKSVSHVAFILYKVVKMQGDSETGETSCAGSNNETREHTMFHRDTRTMNSLVFQS